jgi:hypothetical protein
VAVSARGGACCGFARAVLPAQAVALSTQSSLASLPAMLAVCRTLGVRETTADFVLPLAVAMFRATSPAMNLGGGDLRRQADRGGADTDGDRRGVAVALLTTVGSVSLPGAISFVTSDQSDRAGDGGAARTARAARGGRDAARHRAHDRQRDDGRRRGRDGRPVTPDSA